LQECQTNNYSRVIFSKSLKSGMSFVPKEDDDKNWDVYNYGIIHIWYSSSMKDIICEVKHRELSDDYMVLSYSLLPIYLRNLDKKGLSLHSALAEYNGKGILFAAPGGTGKSTCYNRLPDYWKPLCDDETLVVLDKNDTYRAHPFPTWSDYLMKRKENTWDVQYSVPLSAIFFIEQSDHDEIIYIDRREATLSITGSAKQILAIFLHGMKKEQKIDISTKMFNNAFDMAKKIPVFRLLVSLNGQFWKEVEKVVE